MDTSGKILKIAKKLRMAGVNSAMKFGPYMIDGAEGSLAISAGLHKTKDVWQVDFSGTYGVGTEADMKQLQIAISRLSDFIEREMRSYKVLEYYARYSGVGICEVCGIKTEYYDYDLHSYFCKDHIQQPGFTKHVDEMM